MNMLGYTYFPGMFNQASNFQQFSSNNESVPNNTPRTILHHPATLPNVQNHNSHTEIIKEEVQM